MPTTDRDQGDGADDPGEVLEDGAHALALGGGVGHVLTHLADGDAGGASHSTEDTEDPGWRCRPCWRGRTWTSRRAADVVNALAGLSV